MLTDPEMETRIREHQRQRPSCWETVEEPVELIKTLKNIKQGSKGIIIDCITLWVSNLIYHKRLNYSQIIDYANECAQILHRSKKDIVVVTNELGMGIVPNTEESRYYRKIAGEVNQIFAKMSNKAYFILSGLPMKIK